MDYIGASRKLMSSLGHLDFAPGDVCVDKDGKHYVIDSIDITQEQASLAIYPFDKDDHNDKLRSQIRYVDPAEFLHMGRMKPTNPSDTGGK